jgi:hypothetical protein
MVQYMPLSGREHDTHHSGSAWLSHNLLYDETEHNRSALSHFSSRTNESIHALSTVQCSQGMALSPSVNLENGSVDNTYIVYWSLFNMWNPLLTNLPLHALSGKDPKHKCWCDSDFHNWHAQKPVCACLHMLYMCCISGSCWHTSAKGI